MATINNNEEFVLSVNQLIDEEYEGLVPDGVRVIKPSDRIVLDETVLPNGKLKHKDITPDITVLESALDRYNVKVSDKEKESELYRISKKDALSYFIKSLINANGNKPSLLVLYNRAIAYEALNSDLQALMASKIAIREIVTGSSLDLDSNAGKATYLELFESCLVLISANGI